MSTLALADTARKVFVAASQFAKELQHDELDAVHLFYVLLRETEAGHRWSRHVGIDDRTQLLDTLRSSINLWFTTGSGISAPTPSYFAASRRAEAIARQAASSVISPAHILNAILEIDERLRLWLLEQQIELVPVELEVSTPLLDSLGRNLTDLAKQGDLPTVIGRDDELEQLIEILLRRGKSNALLLGAPGTGKTAIVEKLAQRIVAKDVPLKLHHTELIELNVASLVAGTTYRGEFEERVQQVIDELQRNSNAILVLDEFHTIMGAGTTRDGGPDIANMLKPALARGEIRCIGITTNDEYRRLVEKDKALVRRFATIRVSEPSSEETLDILRALAPEYASHHRIIVDEDALLATVKWTNRYLVNRHFPDKAVDVLAVAATRAELQKLQRVTPELVASVITDMVGIPIGDLSEDIKQNLLTLEQRLNAQIIGQEEAIATVSRAVRIAYTDLKDPERPRAVFLFIGPSGVGKTELARCLARALFGSENNLIRLDMSEYADRLNISRLIGGAPGYVGYDEPGQLTQPLRERPYSVVLFDEVEKAHRDVFDLFLQLFDEGRLTDSHGNTVNGRNAIFIMTTNLGAHATRCDAMGFSGPTYVASESDLRSELERYFRPELLNRVDHLVTFRALELDDLEEIARLVLDQIASRLAEKEIKLTYEATVPRIIAKQACTHASAARAVRRVAENLVVVPVSDALLSITGPEKEWIHLAEHRGIVTLEWI